MLQPGRHRNTGDYRYGFQGQEMDNEVKGEGKSINYKFRIHDPRVGRFFAVDPLIKKYPHYSPYSFSGNKVIHRNEIEGLEDGLNWVLQQKENAFLETASEEEIAAYRKMEHEVFLYTWGGIATIVTGGLAYELYISGRLAHAGWQTASWLYLNQETAIGIGGLAASVIDPDPTNDYPGNFDDLARPLKYLFRGTTKGYAGGGTAVRNGVTYLSEDPLISTIFAESARTKGSPVLHIAKNADINDLKVVSSNVFEDVEREVILQISPTNFVERAVTLTLDEARIIFKEMDIAVPTGINKDNLQRTLNETKHLTNDQIEEFVERAYKLVDSKKETGNGG